MSAVLLEAALLACPDPGNYPAEERYEVIDRYLDRLATFSRLRAQCDFINFWRDETLIEVLHASSAYPFRHSLAAAFSYLDPEDDFQLEDANRLATALLERSLVLEFEGPVKDLVVSDVGAAPEEERRLPAYKEQLARTAALALPLLGDGKSLGPNVLVGTPTRQSNAVSVTYTLDLVEHADGKYTSSKSQYKVELKAFLDAETAIRELDLDSLWAERAYAECIAIQAIRTTAESAAAYAEKRAMFSLGSGLLESARKLGFLHDLKKVGRLRRVCSDLILGRNLANSHWLRKGMGANDPQRMRGTWGAWRHDIDDEFHLHYWKSGSSIEFANVVTHNDFAIIS